MYKNSTLDGFSKELNVLNTGVSEDKNKKFTQQAVDLFEERLKEATTKYDTVDSLLLYQMYKPEMNNVITDKDFYDLKSLKENQIADMFKVSYYLGKRVRPEANADKAMAAVDPNIHMWILLNEDMTKLRLANILSHYNKVPSSYLYLVEFIRLSSIHPGFFNFMANYRDPRSDELPYCISRNLFSNRMLNKVIHSVVNKKNRSEMEDILDAVYYVLDGAFFIDKCHQVGIHEDIINDKVRKIKIKYKNDIFDIVSNVQWEPVINNDHAKLNDL